MQKSIDRPLTFIGRSALFDPTARVDTAFYVFWVCIRIFTYKGEWKKINLKIRIQTLLQTRYIPRCIICFVHLTAECSCGNLSATYRYIRKIIVWNSFRSCRIKRRSMQPFRFCFISEPKDKHAEDCRIGRRLRGCRKLWDGNCSRLIAWRNSRKDGWKTEWNGEKSATAAESSRLFWNGCYGSRSGKGWRWISYVFGRLM